jgi:hypothetical protein
MKLRNARRLAMVAMAIAPISTMLQAAPASAAPSGFIVVVGTAKLPTFPCSPNCAGGTFSSTLATGVAGTEVVTNVTAGFTYNEQCAGGEPLTGDASGTLKVFTASTFYSVHFEWLRVGLVAVITGAPLSPTPPVGAAVFVPSPLPACGSSSAVDATVAGGGVLL